MYQQQTENKNLKISCKIVWKYHVPRNKLTKYVYNHDIIQSMWVSNQNQTNQNSSSLVSFTNAANHTGNQEAPAKLEKDLKHPM